MKLIVGLGNPGEKYRQNRHNAGFMFVDYLLQNSPLRQGFPLRPPDYEGQVAGQAKFKYDKYLLSEVALLPEFILAKPQTYMNKSGDAVKKLLEKYLTSRLIVIHDDLDIPFGKFKIQIQGPKQHNGITDIQNKLRTMDFLRVRIGVDSRPPENRMSGEEYVLQNFTLEEQSQLPELFKKIEKRFEAFLQSENDCN